MNNNQKMAHEITYRLVDAGAADQKVMDACEKWVLEKLDAQPVSQRYKLPDGFVAVPRSLTAENGAKAALIGEFNLEYNLVCHERFGEGCDDCSGEGRWINSIPVDWTTIKEIWAKAIEHFDSSAPEAP
ncbi:hypothetical protein [Pantoea rwandensis]|uniref:Uncharacterized protein n=1 Tax=Pantoea rwandensis TaxID=1076550 RepID=A0A1X1CNT7_9GAMM|nr:hypothetical protein [Pantoea rwandensis]ORM66093.1 hypothetical protein HA51_23925 [Pantoea rwandensis]